MILSQPKPDPNFNSFYALVDHLNYYYKVMLEELNIHSKYNMRTIRCRFATDWVMKKTECELSREPIPFNPLQHESSRTTEYYYAEKGAKSVD